MSVLGDRGLRLGAVLGIVLVVWSRAVHVGASVDGWWTFALLRDLVLGVALGVGVAWLLQVVRKRRTGTSSSAPDTLVAAVLAVAVVPALMVRDLLARSFEADPLVSDVAPGAGYLLDAEAVEPWSIGESAVHALADAAIAAPALLAVAVLATGVRRARSAAAHDASDSVTPGSVITRREAIRYSSAGAASIALGSAGLITLSPSAGAVTRTTPWLRDDLELFINEGEISMIDRKRVFSLGYGIVANGVDDRGGLHVPGPVIWTTEGDTVRFGVTNQVDGVHSFDIPGVYSSGPIGVDERVEVEFTAPAAGTYMYSDASLGPVNRLLGLQGALVVMPADGSMRSTTSLPLAQWEFKSQWVWVFNTIDPSLNKAVSRGDSIDLSRLRLRFRPKYFSINGRQGSLAAHVETAPDTVVVDELGNAALIRVVNAGMSHHAPHFHGNHVYPLVRDRNVQWPIMWKDTIMVRPEECVDLHLPFNIPPNGVRYPPDPKGSAYLKELHGKDMEGTWPMHCHVEMSQTANGGYYPQGLLTDWKVKL